MTGPNKSQLSFDDFKHDFSFLKYKSIFILWACKSQTFIEDEYGEARWNQSCRKFTAFNNISPKDQIYMDYTLSY